MFANIGAMAQRGVGGLHPSAVHDALRSGVRERFGNVVRAAIQATVDSL